MSRARSGILPTLALLTAIALPLSLLAQQTGHDASMAPARGPRRYVAVFLYPHAIMFDYAPAAELFRVAGHAQAFSVYTVGTSTAPIPAMFPQTVTPQYDFEHAPQPTVVVIPGGMSDEAVADPRVAAWLKRVQSQGAILFSVCTGAFVLADLGFLDGHAATTNHAELATLGKKAPKARVVSDKDYVDEGNLVTAAGAATGIDATLHLIQRLVGKDDADWLAHVYLDYKYWHAG
jgi:transcriptional regulator GlxA family with amidase domain